MANRMKFKGIFKTLNSNGKRRKLMIDLDRDVSLDMLEAFIDQLCEFTIEIPNDDDVVEVYIDGDTGEVVG